MPTHYLTQASRQPCNVGTVTVIIPIGKRVQRNPGCSVRVRLTTERGSLRAAFDPHSHATNPVLLSSVDSWGTEGTRPGWPGTPGPHQPTPYVAPGHHPASPAPQAPLPGPVHSCAGLPFEGQTLWFSSFRETPTVPSTLSPLSQEAPGHAHLHPGGTEASSGSEAALQAIVTEVRKTTVPNLLKGYRGVCRSPFTFCTVPQAPQKGETVSHRRPPTLQYELALSQTIAG